MNTQPSQHACYHCGLPVPPGGDYPVEILGEVHEMCCPGCQAVAQAIVDHGLTDFYRHRTERSKQAEELVPQALLEMSLYDKPEIQKSFVTGINDNVKEAALMMEGIVCAACVWLNEKHINALPGVIKFQVNYSTHRARLQWDDTKIHLSDILREITSIGYVAHPYDPGRTQEIQTKERKQALRRLAVAGIFTMQVMMLSIAMYLGEYEEMDEGLKGLMRAASLVFTLPVILYSGKTFFVSAWRDLRRKTLGMDVPVSLAIGGAFIASVWATATSSGETYFDSVTMFTFFLLTGRYLEMGARHKAAQVSEELVRLLPATAVRLVNGQEEVVSVAELHAGDEVLIKPGTTVPADGVVLKGVSAVDESLLTGESMPVSKKGADTLVGGTVNTESPLVMRVEKTGQDTVLSSIVRLLDRAQSEKPRIAQVADRVAAWFVGALLVLASAVALYWWQQDPENAFWITLSVLVVTCPCALSLATPTAVVAATGRLTQLGLLTTRGHVLEALAGIHRFVFDKTGTLTEGRLLLELVMVYKEGVRQQQCIDLAAGLERFSEHPIAHAIVSRSIEYYQMENVLVIPGVGIQGDYNGHHYQLGATKALLANTGQHAKESDLQGEYNTIALLKDGRLLCTFLLQDKVRSESRAAVDELHAMGIQTSLYSGDRQAVVDHVAHKTGIQDALGELKPQAKLAHLKELQAQQQKIAMVGDGVNDAPVLAGADVSIAMGGGTQLAQATADMILLSENLCHLPEGVRIARQTAKIIRQNLAWAVTYNLLAIPLAAAGLVAPWMAAIGMSLSSLIVVLNALRLKK